MRRFRAMFGATTTKSIGVCVAVLLVAAGAVGCSDEQNTPTTDPDALTGNTYVSTAVAGPQIPGGGPLVLSFPKFGTVSAKAGCNGHGGSVAFKGETMTVGTLVGTMMACPPPRGGSDKWINELFDAPVTWQLDDKTLTLSRGERKVTLAQREDQPLVGTKWQVDATVSGQGTTSSAAIERARPFIQIDSEGKLTGNAGCNAMTGSATVSPTKIEFSPVATTRKMCDPETMDVERAVLAALAGAVNYQVDGTKLSITNATDSSVGLRLHVAD